jgi:hypothetical protein
VVRDVCPLPILYPAAVFSSLEKKIIQVGNCAFPAWKKIYSSWKTVFFNLENATLDIARIFLQ